MYFVCVGFKHAGEATLLESSTAVWRKRSAQKTNSYGANSSKQRSVWASPLQWLHQELTNWSSFGGPHRTCIDYQASSTLLFSTSCFDILWSFSVQIKVVTNITSWGLRLTPMLTYTHTPSPALTLSNPFDALWTISNVERVLCFSQTVWTFLCRYKSTTSPLRSGVSCFSIDQCVYYSVGWERVKRWSWLWCLDTWCRLSFQALFSCPIWQLLIMQQLFLIEGIFKSHWWWIRQLMGLSWQIPGRGNIAT